MSGDRPRVGISRCLLGDEVRYDGGHKFDSSLVSVLSLLVELVPVCPEVEIGMGVPREPIQLVAARHGVPSASARVRLVGVTSRTDWTMAMVEFGARRIDELRAHRLAGFVLKARSPSCGPHDVSVNSAPSTPAGRGLFAEALIASLPDLPVDDEERLKDMTHRAAFIERVFAYHERALR